MFLPEGEASVIAKFLACGAGAGERERERETAGGAGNGERMRTGQGPKALQNACPCFWGPALGERLGRRIAAVVLGQSRPGIANANGFGTLAP